MYKNEKSKALSWLAARTWPKNKRPKILAAIDPLIGPVNKNEHELASQLAGCLTEWTWPLNFVKLS